LTAPVGRWIAGCARNRFQAVEPDNLDSYSRSQRLLTLTDDLRFATLLVQRAHAEECQVYWECSSYTSAYGRHVVEIEYTDNGRRFYRRACAARQGDLDPAARPRRAPARPQALRLPSLLRGCARQVDGAQPRALELPDAGADASVHKDRHERRDLGRLHLVVGLVH
jgi:hypothetical protein